MNDLISNSELLEIPVMDTLTEKLTRQNEFIKILIQKVEDSRKDQPEKEYQADFDTKNASANPLFICQFCQISFNPSLFETKDVFMEKFQRHVDCCNTKTKDTCKYTYLNYLFFQVFFFLNIFTFTNI